MSTYTDEYLKNVKSSIFIAVEESVAEDVVGAISALEKQVQESKKLSSVLEKENERLTKVVEKVLRVKDEIKEMFLSKGEELAKAHAKIAELEGKIIDRTQVDMLRKAVYQIKSNESLSKTRLGEGE